jgi:putative oxidoreductase
MLSNKYLLLVARLLLGSMFIVASIDKIAAPEAFAANIVAYKLIPYALVNIMALVVPWMELLCGIFLVGGVYTRGSSALISILLVVFIVAIMTALLRELKIDCGCFGKEHATPVSWMKVLEDVGLLILGLYSYRFSRGPENNDRTEVQRVSAS